MHLCKGCMGSALSAAGPPFPNATAAEARRSEGSAGRKSMLLTVRECVREDPRRLEPCSVASALPPRARRFLHRTSPSHSVRICVISPAEFTEATSVPDHSPARGGRISASHNASHNASSESSS